MKSLFLAAITLSLVSAPLPGGERAGPDWWSFQKPIRKPAPAAQRAGWRLNPIDAFILARLEERGLEPAPEADRLTLIRRLTFDLLGLPPSPDEVEAFLEDVASDAYERLVDRLLLDPRHGERWGRHWLDAARFSESHGFEYDRLREHAWRYRDYVIDAFNADLPYTQFIRDQIAGDVLERATPQSIAATGFLVSGPWDEAGNLQASQVMRSRAREEELEDMVGTVSQTFLGITANCARCHDHKFDPLDQRDYYRMKAAFEDVRHGTRPALPRQELEAREREAAEARRQMAELAGQAAALERLGRGRLPARAAARSAGGGETVLAPAAAPAPTAEAAPASPRPMAWWDFSSGPRDRIGSMHGELQGGASIRDGRLRLDRKGAFLVTAPLAREVREKTLEAVVSLAGLEQQGGGVLSIETRDGGAFDAIVFGELEPARWIAGSNFYRRTRKLGGAAEIAGPGDLVHVAAVYRADGSIALFRNGAPYGEPYTPEGQDARLQAYAAGDGRVLIGLRHTGAGNGFLAGEVAEARLYDRALSAAEVALAFRSSAASVSLDEVLAALTPEERRRRQDCLDRIGAAQAKLDAAPPVPLAYAANPQPSGPTHVLARGDIENRGELVSAGGFAGIRTLASDFGLAPDAPEGLRRRKLADWIASADNPLTARVLVNRIWHHHFGRGIVGTPGDFGFNGDRPSHPELLDWLAVEFMESGWSIKKIQRLIACSNAYRQRSSPQPKAVEIDAEDRLLWRYPPRRLEAEAIRDAMLAASGQLNRRMGGPSFRPFRLTVFNSNFYIPIDPVEPEFQRRTIYRINVQSAKSPFLDSFDCPDPATRTPARAVTTTPLQALGLMNNSFVLRQARCLAERAAREGGAGLDQQVALAFRLALGRPPLAAELRETADLAREHGLESAAWVLLNTSEFLYLR